MVRRSQTGETFRVLWKHRSGLAGSILLIGYLLIAIFGPFLAPQNPYAQDLSLSLRPGFWSDRYVSPFLLGTDLHGRDIASRILYGARLTIGMAIASVLASTFVGLVLGILAGYHGGLLDQLLMFINDVLMAFPTILLAIIFIAVFGPGLDKAIFAVALVFTPRIVRVARSATLGMRELDYILAARAAGVSSAMIQIRHIFPNLLAPVMVQATFSMSQAITTIAGLGFLGLGAQPPLPEWGAMLSDALRYMMSRIWWYPLFPGLMITGIVLGFNMTGDGLRDALDPKLRRVRL
jgi:ABC-type dipeptide/oligopeptide/nickel transport system permease subunit